MPTATTIATIGDLIDHGYRVYAHCLECQTNRRVDLAAVAQRLGRDRSYIGGLPLRCSTCGKRGASMTIHPGR